MKEKEHLSGEMVVVDASSERNERRNLLEAEIENLREKLEDAESKQDSVNLMGIPSIKQGMATLAPFPIVIHILMQLLSVFMLNGGDTIVSNLLIPLSKSMLFALYFSVPMAGVILLFSFISNHYYKECLAKKESYRAIVEFLKEEIKAKTLEYEQLKSEPVSPESITDDGYGKRTAARLKMISELKKYRKYLKNGQYRLFVIDKYIKELGITKEEIELATAHARIFRIEKISDKSGKHSTKK